METIDPNLVIFHKIFQIPEILETYNKLKRFNCYLPDGWKQLDLFKYQNYSLSLLLGVEKEAENWFTYHFLSEEISNPDNNFANKISITFYSLGPDTWLFSQTKSPNDLKAGKIPIFTYMKASMIKDEYIKNEHISIQRFIELFDPAEFV